MTLPRPLHIGTARRWRERTRSFSAWRGGNSLIASQRGVGVEGDREGRPYHIRHLSLSYTHVERRATSSMVRATLAVALHNAGED